jgi:hypothetical protein
LIPVIKQMRAWGERQMSLKWMDTNSMCIVNHVTWYEAIASSMFLPEVVWIGSFACFGVARESVAS